MMNKNFVYQIQQLDSNINNYKDHYLSNILLQINNYLQNYNARDFEKSILYLKKLLDLQSQKIEVSVPQFDKQLIEGQIINLQNIMQINQEIIKSKQQDESQIQFKNLVYQIQHKPQVEQLLYLIAYDYSSFTSQYAQEEYLQLLITKMKDGSYKQYFINHKIITDNFLLQLDKLLTFMAQNTLQVQYIKDEFQNLAMQSGTDINIANNNFQTLNLEQYIQNKQAVKVQNEVQFLEYAFENYHKQDIDIQINEFSDQSINTFLKNKLLQLQLDILNHVNNPQYIKYQDSSYPTLLEKVFKTLIIENQVTDEQLQQQLLNGNKLKLGKIPSFFLHCQDIMLIFCFKQCFFIQLTKFVNILSSISYEINYKNTFCGYGHLSSIGTLILAQQILKNAKFKTENETISGNEFINNKIVRILTNLKNSFVKFYQEQFQHNLSSDKLISNLNTLLKIINTHSDYISDTGELYVNEQLKSCAVDLIHQQFIQVKNNANSQFLILQEQLTKLLQEEILRLHGTLAPLTIQNINTDLESIISAFIQYQKDEKSVYFNSYRSLLRKYEKMQYLYAVSLALFLEEIKN